MRTTSGGVTKALGLAMVVIAALYAWWWLDRRRDFEAHPRETRVASPRAIEPLAAVPNVLEETSGIAVSRAQPGILWSHNDSGGGPFLYAIDMTGRLVATVRLTDARNADWEDIALGPCPAGLSPRATGDRSADCLYVGDIGDNNRGRPELTIYVVPEPLLDAGGGASIDVPARSLRFRYPGERDDSEALAVAPDGDVFIVTKGRTGSNAFFRLPAAQIAEALTSGEVLVAEDLGSTGIDLDARVSRLVTGAAVSPDGQALAVRTYYEVFFYRRGADGRRWERTGDPCYLGDLEPQGEAIDYLDSTTLILTSETSRGRTGWMHRLRC